MLPVLIGVFVATAAGVAILLTMSELAEKVREFIYKQHIKDAVRVYIKKIANSKNKTVIKFDILDQYDSQIAESDYTVEGEVELEGDIYEGAVITI